MLSYDTFIIEIVCYNYNCYDSDYHSSLYMYMHVSSSPQQTACTCTHSVVRVLAAIVFAGSSLSRPITVIWSKAYWWIWATSRSRSQTARKLNGTSELRPFVTINYHVWSWLGTTGYIKLQVTISSISYRRVGCICSILQQSFTTWTV